MIPLSPTDLDLAHLPGFFFLMIFWPPVSVQRFNHLALKLWNGIDFSQMDRQLLWFGIYKVRSTFTISGVLVLTGWPQLVSMSLILHLPPSKAYFQSWVQVIQSLSQGSMVDDVATVAKDVVSVVASVVVALSNMIVLKSFKSRSYCTYSSLNFHHALHKKCHFYRWEQRCFFKILSDHFTSGQKRITFKKTLLTSLTKMRLFKY